MGGNSSAPAISSTSNSSLYYGYDTYEYTKADFTYLKYAENQEKRNKSEAGKILI